MGDLPIRLMSSSPHVTEDLAANLALAGLAVGHQALARRQHGDAKTTEDTGQLVGLDVDPETWLRDPAQPRDGADAVGRVLHADLEHAAGPAGIVGDGPALDVALALEDARQGLLELGRRHAHRVVHRS